MNFPVGLFPETWAWGACVPLALLWLWCLRTAPWKRLADSSQMNVWMGTIVVLIMFWLMKAGIKPGLNLHLLGATAFTLMFGRQLAILGFSIVVAGVTLSGGAGWEAYALNVLLSAAFPCFVADGLLRIVERYLPPNFFCYIFCAAFFGAAIAAVATGLLTCIVLWLAGVYPAEKLISDYFEYFILLGYAEAWMNGMLITLMVVYYPHWVSSFDDRRYLRKRQ
jgi:uncharacterized membrane protein